MLLVPSDWSGSVSVTATNQSVTPASRAFASVSAPQFGIDFFAGALPQPPVITSASNASGQVGQVFGYQITASNNPTLFGATGLPSGLTVNTNTGAISGTLTAAGSFSAQILAANESGTNTASLSITILPLPGLISWWRDEGDAIDAMDVHPGTPQGGLGYAAGQVGQAFTLDGQNAAVALGNWFNLQQFTLSLWVKPGATQVEHADILDNNHTAYRSWAFQSANESDATRSYWLWGTSEPSGGAPIRFWLTRGAWQHWVVTLGADRVQRLYLDGKLAGSTTNTAPIPYDGTQYFNIGKHPVYGRYFNGLVDELMVFDRALSPAEVTTLYGSQGGRPALEIQPQPGGVLLSWPAGAANTTLESRTDLGSGSWVTVTNAVFVPAGDRTAVLLPATDGQCFFRLKAGN